MKNDTKKLYKLIGADGNPYFSEQKGILGGHKGLKIYGRLDCPSVLRHIACGGYVKHRVFFADEETAIAAGYRPCAACMKEQYALRKQRQKRSVKHAFKRGRFYRIAVNGSNIGRGISRRKLKYYCGKAWDGKEYVGFAAGHKYGKKPRKNSLFFHSKCQWGN